MYYTYTEEELRSLCRQSIESLEMWARRLIHEKFEEKYGHNYINVKVSDDNYLIKKEVRNHVQRMLTKDPRRFPRIVDTLFFDHIIYFLCNPAFYRDLFKEALGYAYPNGNNEVHVFLDRILPIRNALSHSNPISIRQAEQAICYSHDFIDGLKEYYKAKGMEQVWNVPRIIRVTDSLGNVFDNPKDSHTQQSIFELQQELRCGDTYSINVDIDTSFFETEYDITWKNQNVLKPEFNNSKNFIITFDESDVEEVHTIKCIVKSHKSWHKYKYYDCKITMMFTVLPPF